MLTSVLIVSRFIEPAKLPEICLFKIITAIPCMFCGLTNAFHAISLGRMDIAFDFHPLGFFAFGLVVFLFVFSIIKLVFWNVFVSKLSVEITLLKAAFVIFSVFWVYRLFSGSLI